MQYLALATTYCILLAFARLCEYVVDIIFDGR